MVRFNILGCVLDLQYKTGTRRPDFYITAYIHNRWKVGLESHKAGGSPLFQGLEIEQTDTQTNSWHYRLAHRQTADITDWHTDKQLAIMDTQTSSCLYRRYRRTPDNTDGHTDKQMIHSRTHRQKADITDWHTDKKLTLQTVTQTNLWQYRHILSI